jgi:hypothetical protein
VVSSSRWHDTQPSPIIKQSTGEIAYLGRVENESVHASMVARPRAHAPRIGAAEAPTCLLNRHRVASPARSRVGAIHHCVSTTLYTEIRDNGAGSEPRRREARPWRLVSVGGHRTVPSCSSSCHRTCDPTHRPTSRCPPRSGSVHGTCAEGIQLSYMRRQTSCKVELQCILRNDLSLRGSSMSYAARTFNVMIASPGDVASERAIVRDVVYEWNAVHSNSRKLVLLPVGWETHSSPEMGSPAQSIINKQVLGRCDLLVGVFWTRLGTPTERHLSGTVEEIEEHISAGKPAMLYFSSQPVALDSVDVDQFQRLKKFKESCQPRGLYESYESHSDFKDKLYRHLQLKVNDHPFFLLSDESHTGTNEVVESKTKIPQLSQEARVLLKEASQDREGTIIYAQYIGGTAIQTNGKNLVDSLERREVAKWEDALNQLRSLKLVVDRGHKGEVFEITNLGYQIADMIAL